MSLSDTDLLTAGLPGISCLWSKADNGRGRGTAGRGGTLSDGALSATGTAPGGRGGGGRLLHGACVDFCEGSLTPGRRDLSPVANRCLRRSGKDDFLVGPLDKIKQKV